MKKGRIAVFDQIDGRAAAALLVNGKLDDLIIDPKSDRPVVGAIYRAKLGRPMKGQGGSIVDLGNGQSGYLRGAKGLREGEILTVQISSFAEEGKAAPCTTKVIFKGAYAIWTPGAPGRNIARSIKDENTRDRLSEVAHYVSSEANEDWGLILRSGAGEQEDAVLIEELETLHAIGQDILSDKSDVPCLLFEPNAHQIAMQNWNGSALKGVEEFDGAFEQLGVFDHIHAIGIEQSLPSGGFFTIEPTRALVAIDVNTGGDFSLMAGQKANIETAKELPRALRLRGLGGQIVVDFAPSPKKDRRRIEEALRAAFKADGIETALVGWTPLGHYELQRKRERLPLTDCL